MTRQLALVSKLKRQPWCSPGAKGWVSIRRYLQVLRGHPADQVAVGVELPGRLALEEVAQQLRAVGRQQVARQPPSLAVRQACRGPQGSGVAELHFQASILAGQRLAQLRQASAGVREPAPPE